MVVGSVPVAAAAAPPPATATALVTAGCVLSATATRSVIGG